MKFPLKCKLFYWVLDSFLKKFTFCFSNSCSLVEDLGLASKTKADAYRRMTQRSAPGSKNKCSQGTGYSQETAGLFLQLGASALSKVGRKKSNQFAYPSKVLFLSSTVSIHCFIHSTKIAQVPTLCNHRTKCQKYRHEQEW